MVSLIPNVRGTVQGVLEASRHIAWFVSWHTSRPSGEREARGRQTA